MRNRGSGVILSFFLLLGLIVITSGCATPRHTDTLIFGTNSKIAVDLAIVGDGPTTRPELTIGYKRQEFVWMPLLANGKDSCVINPSKCTKKEVETLTSLKEKGIDIEVLDSLGDKKYTGTSGKDQDTYSVLASFGGDIGGGTDGSATVSIAQYFATGHAARILAKSGEKLVSVQSPATQANPQDPEAQKLKDDIHELLADDDGGDKKKKANKWVMGKSETCKGEYYQLDCFMDNSSDKETLQELYIHLKS